MKEVGMLDDLEFVSMVHLEFLKHCKDNVNDIIRTAIQGAVDCYQWKNISYLVEKHAEMIKDKVLNRNLKFVFAADPRSVFFPSLGKDRRIVLEAVKHDGCALKYADDPFKKDKEVVMIAVKQNGAALHHAHHTLKKDKEVVLEAVKTYGMALKYADASFKKDKEVVMAAVKQRGSAFYFADSSLKKDMDVISVVRTC